MIKRPKVLVVGSLNMDLISTTLKFPNEGETVTGQAFSTAPGGKGANQAVQAALLGADVTMVGKVGDDIFGTQIITSLSESGVNVEYVMKDINIASGVANIILEIREGQKTKNRILILPGANMGLTVEDVGFLKEEITNYDVVILQQEIPIDVNEAIVGFAYAKDIPVMLNSAPSRPIHDDVLVKLAYISPNEHEAADLTGIKINVNSNGVDLDTVRTVTNSLLNRGVRNVIITLGSNGVVLANKSNFIYQPCIDVVEVVDPTAAGDSFIGAFCTAICQGMSEESALEFASYAATITVSRLGAQPSLPSYQEVIALMESVKNNSIN